MSSADERDANRTTRRQAIGQPERPALWASYVGRLPGGRDALGGVVEFPAF